MNIHKVGSVIFGGLAFLAGTYGFISHSLAKNNFHEMSRYHPTLNYSIVSDQEAMLNTEDQLRQVSAWVRSNDNIDCYHLGTTVQGMINVNLMSIDRRTQTSMNEYNGKTAFEAFQQDSSGFGDKLTKICLNDPNENMIDTAGELLKLSSKASDYGLSISNQLYGQ